MLQKNSKANNLPSSFRDPSGSVYYLNGEIFRRINYSYKENYDLLMSSGLYDKLVSAHYLVPHREIKPPAMDPSAYKIIKPVRIPFISYPFEWSFGQLKDAALLTLSIQKLAMSHGMSLKDSTSFNIQFLEGKPILIDTLSFEKYVDGKPWIAYKQFCEQFLAPLTLVADKDINLSKLLIPFAGTIPLDLAVKLLPLKSKFRPATFLHLVAHAKSQKKYDDTPIAGHKGFINKNSLMGLIENLELAVKNLEWKPKNTVWTDYYSEKSRPSYDDKSFLHKKNIVSKFLKTAKTKTLWDLGANTGEFSRVAAKQGIFTVSMDFDPTVVEINYRQVKSDGEKNILPLWIDLMNPTPAIGWGNSERDSLLNRPHPDTILALALVHHLAIANNLPLPMLSDFFAKLCKNLIIEFVPKTDPQTQRLLQSRQDIFPNYNQESFEKEFSKLFRIVKREELPDSDRILYFMTKK